ncbi:MULTISPECIES: hypothetical protein [Clostridium]|uniref:ATPase n=1 Tax=Clostridium senegalense TaxID=1465809 RepID=A0A6M0H419_9CLOT|nr:MULTISPECIES: hypothetical protein [Clostridium]NEU04964.1 ATPase [Clostridium senegalense]
MALEAINKVKLAEEEAIKVIDEATVKGKTLIMNAEKKAKNQYDEILSKATKEGEVIKAKFLEDSNEKCKPILEKGKKEVQEILNSENDNFPKAVKSVIERIVNFNGNS